MSLRYHRFERTECKCRDPIRHSMIYKSASYRVNDPPRSPTESLDSEEKCRGSFEGTARG